MDHLLIGKVTPITSNKPTGTVISTSPRAGVSVKNGQSVELNVSLGQSVTTVTVPDVTGMSIGSAESMLQQRNLGYTVNFTTTPPANSPGPDTVLSQSPSGGSKVQSGQKVIIVVLAPGTKIPVPDVSGDSSVQAASTLGQAGLTTAPTQQHQCSNTVPSGDVISTLPVAGTPESSGTSVILVTSSGVCQVVVPGVVGDTQSNANSTLTADGLVAAFTTADTSLCTPSQNGTVISQSAAPGSSVPYHTTIDLAVCQGLGSGGTGSGSG